MSPEDSGRPCGCQPATRRARRALVIGSLLLGCWLAPARADVIIIVDTASDVIANDGSCSLREAITAANTNANYYDCVGSGGGYDLIEFDIGPHMPVIDLMTTLPPILDPVEINGGPSRVELRGIGAGDGLVIADTGAAGTVIRNLVINRFTTGDSPAPQSDADGEPEFEPDTDADGVIDLADNCTLVPNPTQCDSDGDGFGNRCDGDFNNNGFTNSQDTTLFRAQLGKPSVAPVFNEADLNCNGFVNSQDTTLYRGLLGSPPGPAGELF